MTHLVQVQYRNSQTGYVWCDYLYPTTRENAERRVLELTNADRYPSGDRSREWRIITK